TELEWRCCPGHSGDNCLGGSSTPRFPPDQALIPGSGLEPGKPFPYPDNRPIPSGHLPAGGVSGERLDRMEEDLRRLSQGLDTLNGLVDTTKMITTLLGSPRRPDSTVGFGVIPEGGPETLDGGEGFPVLGELVGRVTEVKDELRVKSNMLDEIHGMVMGHDGQLKRLLEADTARPVLTGGTQSLLEELLDARLAGVKAEILDGFERRLSGLENHCDERIGQVQQQCEKEHLNGQEQMQLSLDGRETGLRKELGDLQAQIQGLTLTDNCCGQVNSLSQRVLLLEESVKGLTESQRQLQVTLTEQTHHMETQLDARLLDIEGRLNTSDRGEGRLEGFDGHGAGTLDGFKTLLDDKLKNLEERLFVAVEELSNATAPALLEGHVVPMEECKDVEKKVSSRLDTHSDMLDHLNRTLQGLLTQLAQEDQEGSLQGEITLLKINVNSVNRTLKGLRDSVHFFAREIGHANSTWEEREHRLATQVKGITELVGRQSNLLGAGERRLIQMKAELQSLRRRLAGEIRECRSTALGVQQEVMGVESRVSQVEGRCGSLSELADELERIRSELESHSDTYLAQINNTLASHGQQLSQLKEGLQECANKTDPDSHRGDQ
uniref:Elastin microfibril interfacer 3 n=1 Tax=Astyanax mexicanus TaxID=7994 RepID=A0A8B9GUU9_ASTMX